MAFQEFEQMMLLQQLEFVELEAVDNHPRRFYQAQNVFEGSFNMIYLPIDSIIMSFSILQKLLLILSNIYNLFQIKYGIYLLTYSICIYPLNKLIYMTVVKKKYNIVQLYILYLNSVLRRCYGSRHPNHRLNVCIYK